MADDLVFTLEDESQLELNSDYESELMIEDSYPYGEYHEKFLGPYTVTPFLYDEQELITRDKVMTQNLTVKEIPIVETTNLYGGRTIVIG